MDNSNTGVEGGQRGRRVVCMHNGGDRVLIIGDRAGDGPGKVDRQVIMTTAIIIMK